MQILLNELLLSNVASQATSPASKSRLVVAGSRRPRRNSLVLIRMRVLEGQARMNVLFRDPKSIGRLRIVEAWVLLDMDADVGNRIGNIPMRVILHDVFLQPGWTTKR